MSSASAPCQTQASHVSHTTSTTQPPVSYSIGSTYNHQTINPVSANTMSATQSNMGSQFTYFTIPSRSHNMHNYSYGTFQQPPIYTTTNPFVGNIHAQNAPLTETKILTQQVQNLQQQGTTMQIGNDKKSYTMQDLCLYPFDRTICMSAFPPHFETSKFDRYQGKGDLRDHIREFFIASIEVAQEDTYLMRLFPKSLRGPSLEWFSPLPPMITLCGELAE